MAFSATAKAQLYVGGSISVGANFNENKYISLDISPDIGYSFGDWCAGASLTMYLNNGDSTPSTDISISIAPYAEYYFWRSGPLSFYLEGGVDVKVNRYYTDTDSSIRTHVAPYLSPGIEISLTDHWSLMCQVGRLEYGIMTQNLNFRLDGEALSLGLYHSF
jgi:hypothetical protein